MLSVNNVLTLSILSLKTFINESNTSSVFLDFFILLIKTNICNLPKLVFNLVKLSLVESCFISKFEYSGRIRPIQV